MRVLACSEDNTLTTVRQNSENLRAGLIPVSTSLPPNLLILCARPGMIASVAYWSELLAADSEVWIRFQVLPEFFRSSGSGMGSSHA
jgi:hypothetical protein